MKEVQIEQRGVGVPGTGGLNHFGLESLGWRSGMWLMVVAEDLGGVYVQLPKAIGLTWIRNHEVTATKEAQRPAEEDAP